MSLNPSPELKKLYPYLRGKNDPKKFDDWVFQRQPLAPEMRTKLIRTLIDSENIGNTINVMHWTILSLENLRFGFMLGDSPVIMSNGLGHDRSFVILAISPSKIFLAAHNLNVISSFATQGAYALQRALNDACVRQSRHIVIATDDSQKEFVDRRFLKCPVPVGPHGYVAWNPPLVGD